ncbi:hypothetical protein HU200_063941 [Digitaria exilis]|uniref:Uncharacterized protein n=1 Tax=Digitaria exilis TaxID=1010633 RepID=A0A835A0Y7_9POAL|nr:hypothetical protein HU200_063941 [Digitaria exilis]
MAASFTLVTGMVGAAPWRPLQRRAHTYTARPRLAFASLHPPLPLRPSALYKCEPGAAPSRAYLEQRQPPPQRAASTWLEQAMGRQPCCDKVGVKKGPWTAEEDQKLVGFLLTHGHCCWRVVPKLAGLLRCGKSCRLRWTNYLRPDLKRGLLSDDEETGPCVCSVTDCEILHGLLLLFSWARSIRRTASGPLLCLLRALTAMADARRWSKIAAQLPGRTDNEIKNHWNTHIRKKLLRMGIDPVTHLPLHNEPPAPAPPQDQPDQPPPQQQQEHQAQNDGGEHMQEDAGEVHLPPVIQPHDITTTAAASNCGSVSSVSSASVLSPSCSSSASASAPAASGVEAAEWPEPMYLFGMDGIMDAAWDGLFPGAGGGMGVDPFDGYPAGGFDQDDDWINAHRFVGRRASASSSSELA